MKNDKINIVEIVCSKKGVELNYEAAIALQQFLFDSLLEESEIDEK